MNTNYFKQNPVISAAIFGFVAFTIPNIPTMIKDSGENHTLREKAKAVEYAKLSREIDRDAAIAAIEEGCNIALVAEDTSKYADIKNGIRIDAAEGTRVCSRKGDFGVVMNGKLAQVVSAGQPKDVKEFATRVYSGSVRVSRGKQK